jgi:hypothetical protein
MLVASFSWFYLLDIYVNQQWRSSLGFQDSLECLPFSSCVWKATSSHNHVQFTNYIHILMLGTLLILTMNRNALKTTLHFPSIPCIFSSLVTPVLHHQCKSRQFHPSKTPLPTTPTTPSPPLLRHHLSVKFLRHDKRLSFLYANIHTVTQSSSLPVSFE